MIVPSSTQPKVNVSVRIVPTVKGVGFFFARLAASAKGAMMGRKRLNIITSPVAMSHWRLKGQGLLLSLKPQAVFVPPNSEPLLAEAELNS